MAAPKEKFPAWLQAFATELSLNEPTSRLVAEDILRELETHDSVIFMLNNKPVKIIRTDSGTFDIVPVES